MVRIRQLQLHDAVERLLVLSDVHGLIQPLEAFDRLPLRKDSPCRILFNGDFCMPGPKPVEVLKWLRERVGDGFVLGNHDEEIFKGKKGSHPLYTEAGVLQRMGEKDRTYLRSRPHRLEISWRKKRINLMHGHLTREGNAAPWITTPEEQSDNFSDRGADLTILSHSHFPYLLEKEGTLYANTGSMSFPFYAVEKKGKTYFQSGGEGTASPENFRSSFLSVSENAGALEVQIIKFGYDREAAIREIRAIGYPRADQSEGILKRGIVTF